MVATTTNTELNSLNMSLKGLSLADNTSTSSVPSSTTTSSTAPAFLAGRSVEKETNSSTQIVPASVVKNAYIVPFLEKEFNCTLRQLTEDLSCLPAGLVRIVAEYAIKSIFDPKVDLTPLDTATNSKF